MYNFFYVFKAFFAYNDVRLMQNYDSLDLSVTGLDPNCLNIIRFFVDPYGVHVMPMRFSVKFPWEIPLRQEKLLHISDRFGSKANTF